MQSTIRLSSMFLGCFLLLAEMVPAPARATSPEGSGSGLTPATCQSLAGGVDAAPAERRDTAVFDHQAGQVVWPNPAKLVVKDGDVFVIVFKNTDATKFDYGITPLDTEAAAGGLSWKSGTEVVRSRRFDAVCLSWRFDRTFPLYKVSVSRRVREAVVAPKEMEDGAVGTAHSANTGAQLLQPRVTNTSGVLAPAIEMTNLFRQIANGLKALGDSEQDRKQLEEAGKRIDRAATDGLRALALLEAIPNLEAAGREQFETARAQLNAAKDAAKTLEGMPSDTRRVYVGLLEGVVASLEGISEKVGGARELSSYVFPIWVEPADAVVRFSSGFAFSGLSSDKFFVRKANTTNDSHDDDTETVQRDRHARDAFRPDLMTYATIEMPPTTVHKQSWIRNALSGRFGLSLGLGLGDEAQPRYFVGPSVDLGHQLLLTVGVFGGKVDTLPAGQEIGKEPINGANTLSQLGSRFKTGVGFGLSWTFGKDAEKNYLAALSGAQKVPDAAPAKPGKPTGLKIDDTCVLSWTKAAEGGAPEGYVVYKTEAGKTESRGESTETTFKLEKTAKAQEYEVAAKNAAGEGEHSDKVAAKDCPPPPAPPAAPSGLALDTKTCVLTWTASASGAPTGYAVYLGGLLKGEVKDAVYRFAAVTKGDPIHVVAEGAGGTTPSAQITASADCKTP